MKTELATETIVPYHTPLMNQMRLQLFLAKAGVASRRHAEELMTAGKVTVNGKLATELGTQIDPQVDRVEVQGKRIEPEPAVYLLLNKPKGYVTTASDPEERKTIFSLLETPYEVGVPQLERFSTPVSERRRRTVGYADGESADVRSKRSQLRNSYEEQIHESEPRSRSKVPKIPKVRLFSVGRLDYHTEGAIILTNDGLLANRLMHPRYGVEKIYHAKLKGHLTKIQVQALKDGVELPPARELSPGKTKFWVRRRLERTQPKVERSSPAEVRVLGNTSEHTWLELIIHEGKNRQIHRMAEAIGSSLLKLARVQYAFLSVLDMEVGTFRKLQPDEIENLYQMVGLDRTVDHSVKPFEKKQPEKKKEPPKKQKPASLSDANKKKFSPPQKPFFPFRAKKKEASQKGRTSSPPKRQRFSSGE